MISEKYKVIFVHPVKCGGDSITFAMKKIWETGLSIREDGEREMLVFHVGKNGSPGKYEQKHATLQEIYEKNPHILEERDKWYVFSVVRNPWDRVLSRFLALSKKDDYILENGRLNSRLMMIDKEHRLPMQTLDSVKGVDGKPDYDRIIKLEDINNGLKNVCNDLGLDVVKAPMLNTGYAVSQEWKTSEHYYTKFYNKTLMEFIKKKYKDDIEMFGYEFGK